MKMYYDFHIHTGLSPCGDNDMTPNSIVNMALINGLDCIAITDHNSCGNVEAVMQAAEDTDLIVIPGMELETSEEVHVVCLFPTINNAVEFWKIIEEQLPKIKNKPEVFGQQLFFDHEDNIVNEYEYLLINATALSIYEVVDMVKDFNGIAIPAHVDRSSYSIISNLGFIPPDLTINLLEFSKNANPDVFLEEHKMFLKKQFPYLQSSDAHYLGDINEQQHFFEFAERPDRKKIIEMLLKM